MSRCRPPVRTAIVISKESQDAGSHQRQPDEQDVAMFHDVAEKVYDSVSGEELPAESVLFLNR